MPREDDQVVRFNFSDADLQECHPLENGRQIQLRNASSLKPREGAADRPRAPPQRHSTSPHLMTDCQKLGQS